MRDAILAGPLGGFVFGVILTLLMAPFSVSLFPPDMLGYAVFGMPVVGALIGVLLGIPVMLVAGLSAHAVLKAHRFVRSWHYMVSGAAVGAIVALLAGQLGILNFFNSDVHPLDTPPSNLESAVWALPQALLFGASCAYSFWLLRRPDRDAPPNPPTPTS